MISFILTFGLGFLFGAVSIVLIGVFAVNRAIGKELL